MVKRKMKKWLKLGIIFFFIFNYYCFFLFPMPTIINQINSYKMKYGLAIISLISFGWIIIKKDLKLKLNKPLYLIAGLYIIIFYNIIFSILKYGIHSGVWRAAYPFLICLLFFPVQELFNREEHMKKAVQYLAIINIVACILLILQSFVYAKSQVMFMHIPIYEIQGKVGVRNGNIRITFLDTMLLFSFFLSVDYIGNHEETRLDIVNVILSIYTIYFVSQTRSEILICFICLFICIIKRNDKMKLKNFLILIGLFIVIFIFISYMGDYIAKRFTSVPTTSVSTRFDEIGYYIELFKKNPFSGYGMIDPQQGDIESYKKIVYGPLLRFSITDIGIIGQMARSGVFMLIWYFCFIKYIFHKEHLRKHTCMSIFILLSSINLVILDTSRIIMIPFILALYEMDNNKYTGFKLLRQEVEHER